MLGLGSPGFARCQWLRLEWLALLRVEPHGHREDEAHWVESNQHPNQILLWVGTHLNPWQLAIDIVLTQCQLSCPGQVDKLPKAGLRIAAEDLQQVPPKTS